MDVELSMISKLETEPQLRRWPTAEHCCEDLVRHHQRVRRLPHEVAIGHIRRLWTMRTIGTAVAEGYVDHDDTMIRLTRIRKRSHVDAWNRRNGAVFDECT